MRVGSGWLDTSVHAGVAGHHISAPRKLLLQIWKYKMDASVRDACVSCPLKQAFAL